MLGFDNSLGLCLNYAVMQGHENYPSTNMGLFDPFLKFELI